MPSQKLNLVGNTAPIDEQGLIQDFTFELNGHEPIEPAIPRGYVCSFDEVERKSLAGQELPPNVNVYDVTVVDRYIEADPEGYEMVTRHIESLERAMRERGYSITDRVLRAMQDPELAQHPIRSEAERPEDYNDFTRAWVTDPRAEAIRLWRDLVPKAEALDYLTYPRIGRPITNSIGETTTISPESGIQMRFVADAIAIRDRSVAMQVIAETHLQGIAEPGSKIKWLSLACGTAEPSIAAVKSIKEHSGVDAQVVLADLDSNALDHVQENARSFGFKGELITQRTNIVSPNLGKRLAKATGHEVQKYDVVENMGFQEYLPQEGDEIRAFRGAKLPQASEFTKSAFGFVKPGGILISGNMVFPRPQFDYVFGVVDWPVVNARSEESILRVYKEAGILDDPNARIDLFRVKNQYDPAIHVYDIVRVTKLAE